MTRSTPESRKQADAHVKAAMACAKALLPKRDEFERIAFAALVLRLSWKFKGEQ